MSTDEPPEPNFIYKVSEHKITSNGSKCDLIPQFTSFSPVISNQSEWDVEYFAVVESHRPDIPHSPFQFLLCRKHICPHFCQNQSKYTYKIQAMLAVNS